MFHLIIVLLAAALGVAHTFAFAPFGLWWLQPLALAGLFILAQRTSRARRVALWGFAFGLGWFGAGVWWVFISMHRYGGLPPALAALATAVFCAWLALFPALALGLAARFQPRPYLHLGLALPACWALTEWLRGVIFTGFPWLATGYAHTDGPLAGYAPILGVYGVTGIAAALAASLALLSRRKPLGASLSAAIVLGGLGLGQINWASAHGEPLKVRLIQGGV
ncbi:MAG TPA: apolipoprotein N-acyltransferase, partial [Burkholderiaceae bacterium]|nr:apolipoprotein N-acyltransferase [Burkholderiaceae bacterium]